MSSAKVENTHKAYSRPEELTNFITYAVAAALSFVGLVFLLYASIVSASPKIGCFAAFAFIAFAVFAFGALCHILQRYRMFCALCKRIDRNAVALLVFGVFTSVFLVMFVGNGAVDAVWGYTLFAIAAASVIAAVAVNIVNVKEYKIASLILYVILGWACVLRLDVVYNIAGGAFFGLLIGGGAAYFVGVAVLVLRMSASHILSHLFIVSGAVLHFVALYTYVL